MQKRDYAAFERASYGWQEERAPKRKLMPEMLGTLIVCAWRATVNRDHGNWIPHRELFATLATQSSLPQWLLEIIHVERRIDGPVLAEMADMSNGAQISGVLSKCTSGEGFVNVDGLQANQLLDHWEVDFKEEVIWVKEFVAREVNAQS